MNEITEDEGEKKKEQQRKRSIPAVS